MGFLDKIFGTHSERELKRIYPIVDKIESLRDSMMALSDDALKGKTKEFKDRLSNGETLDDILVEAFAVCREAAYRCVEMKPFHCQLLGGLAIHYGNIAEMKTGEGKTLTGVLPAYLNALTGKGVHIVTVNEFLSERDSVWMGNIFKFLGLTVGLNLRSLSAKDKREAYNCDILYTTNNELGFDYLRDNMVVKKEKRVQRKLNFCIVDSLKSCSLRKMYEVYPLSLRALITLILNFKLMVIPPYIVTLIISHNIHEIKCTKYTRKSTNFRAYCQ